MVTMLEKTPIKLDALPKEHLHVNLLRLGLIAELDAINLYEQLSAMADDPAIKQVFLDVAKEEKEHVGEFQTLLLRYDKEQVEELAEGKEEVEEMLEKLGK